QENTKHGFLSETLQLRFSWSLKALLRGVYLNVDSNKAMEVEDMTVKQHFLADHLLHWMN
ncbi:hypothetical protein ILYODFUR_036854, partial [Ilyodon furcidens]